MADQVIAIFAAKEDFLDDIDMENVIAFRDELAAYMQRENDKMRADIRAGVLDDAISEQLKNVIAAFKQDFIIRHPNKVQLNVEEAAEDTVTADDYSLGRA